MPRYDLFTIGHSNIPADRFIAMLRDAEVNAVADVRSVPNSRWLPLVLGQATWRRSLAGAGITYTMMGDALGGRPRDAASTATASSTMRRWRCNPNSSPASIG